MAICVFNVMQRANLQTNFLIQAKVENSHILLESKESQ